MKTRLFSILAVAFLALPLSASAQRTVTQSMQNLQNNVGGLISATAEKVPADLYSYRPTDDVRTLGGILSHLANGNYMFCSAIAGETNPNSENFEETATTKADIQAAVAASLAYCETVYTNTTDAHGAMTANLFGNEWAITGILAFNVAHNNQHYGNLVTYMRLNDIVPPSSAGGM